MISEQAGAKILVKGIVQGVGFRPFVYNLAIRLGLTGWVRNSSNGVEIEINGQKTAVASFLDALTANPPPLAKIDRIESQPIPPDGYNSFEIYESLARAGEFIPISPDVAICSECQRELFDPDDRRYRYPFINCTNCGPRFTIIKDIPYDRPLTTMASFELCPACQAEYDDPTDRRFHAQPVACPDCGPRTWFEVDGKRQDGDGIEIARDWLKKGKILAVKGLGGFHLACDSTQAEAVAELRRRKHRSEKPFALMAFDLATITRHAEVSKVEAGLLQSPAHPVVLLEKRPASPVTAEVAPKQVTLGIMLAYTPLHLLLLEPAPGFPEILVMTSGNLSEEPICYEDNDARQRLNGLADAFLMHDRPIHMRVDDSVVREFEGRPYFIRRSRGYAPDPVHLSRPVKSILAAGSELKNTFCITRQDYAFISHHIGDLENYETLKAYEEGIRHFEHVFHLNPEVIACDLHPGYLASQYARQRAEKESLPLVEVQHHHAHLAACLGENSWSADEPVIGLAYDGTGYGVDGAIWGGEVLTGSYQGYERDYHLSYVPLPGGDLAIRKPSRMALAYLWQMGIEWEPDLPPVKEYCAQDRMTLRSQLEHHLNTAATSSMGRLFDAVAALTGLCQSVNFEGQAAMELEASIDPDETGIYPVNLDAGQIQVDAMIAAIIADWRAGRPPGQIAARFHNSLVKMNLEVCMDIKEKRTINTVALSGGVWQNQFLLNHTIETLKKNGFKVLTHWQLPANDGGLALGQAMVAEYTVT